MRKNAPFDISDNLVEAIHDKTSRKKVTASLLNEQESCLRNWERLKHYSQREYIEVHKHTMYWTQIWRTKMVCLGFWIFHVNGQKFREVSIDLAYLGHGRVIFVSPCSLNVPGRGSIPLSIIATAIPNRCQIYQSNCVYALLYHITVPASRAGALLYTVFWTKP